MVRKKSQHSICFPLLIWIELSNLWGDLSVQQGGMLIGIKDKQEKQKAKSKGRNIEQNNVAGSFVIHFICQASKSNSNC